MNGRGSDVIPHPRRDAKATVVLAILIPVLTLAGCIGSPDDHGDGATLDGVTLVIEFEGFDPTSHPGVRATWTPDGEGNWSLLKEANGGNGTVYIVHNVTARTVLEALVNGSAAAGFAVEWHQESMGAFVDSVDGLVNGQEDHYWSYYINDEYGIIASDKAPVKDGDEVRWVFLGNPFG